MLRIRRGALVASATCPADQRDAAAAALLAEPAPEPVEDPQAEEVELLARWLEGPGACIHAASGTYASALGGGRALAAHPVRAKDRGRAGGEADALASKRLRRASTP